MKVCKFKKIGLLSTNGMPMRQAAGNDAARAGGDVERQSSHDVGRFRPRRKVSSSSNASPAKDWVSVASEPDELIFGFGIDLDQIPLDSNLKWKMCIFMQIIDREKFS